MNNLNIVDIERSNHVQKTNCVFVSQDSFFIRIILAVNILSYTLIAFDEIYLTINQLCSILMLIHHLMIPYEFVLKAYHRDRLMCFKLSLNFAYLIFQQNSYQGYALLCLLARLIFHFYYLT